MENKRHYTAALLAIALAAASVFGIVFASASALKTGKESSLIIVKSVGDPAAAEGLKIGYIENTSALFFDHDAVFSGGGLKDAGSAVYSQYEPLGSAAAVDMEISFNYYYQLNMPKIKWELTRLGNKMEVGKSEQLTLKIRDYYEYYPLEVAWNRPDNTHSMHEWGAPNYDVVNSGSEDRLYDQFVKTFSPAVPENRTLTVFAGKSNMGAVEQGIYRKHNEAIGSLLARGVLFGDYYYITARGNGDFSEYDGTVWRIPCGELDEPVKTQSGGKTDRGPLPEKAELFFRIDGIWPTDTHSVKLSSDGSTLYFCAQDDKGLHVYCLTDPDAGAEQLRIVDIPEEDPGFRGMGVDERSLFILGKNNTVWCIHPEGSSFAMTEFKDVNDQIIDTFGEQGYTLSDMRFAFKDGLLVSAKSYYEIMALNETERNWRYTGTAVFIYSPEKLEYAALIKSSASDAMYFKVGERQSEYGAYIQTQLIGGSPQTIRISWQ